VAGGWWLAAGGWRLAAGRNETLEPVLKGKSVTFMAKSIFIMTSGHSFIRT
jgi:hypothetical protein